MLHHMSPAYSNSTINIIASYVRPVNVNESKQNTISAVIMKPRGVFFSSFVYFFCGDCIVRPVEINIAEDDQCPTNLGMYLFLQFSF